MPIHERNLHRRLVDLPRSGQYSTLYLFIQIALRFADVRFYIAGHPYEVVEGWGTLPDGYTFHQVAGIAADDEDNIYLFMRGDHNVIVLDRDGIFLREWDAKFTQPHGMTIGRDGNIYFADIMVHYSIPNSFVKWTQQVVNNAPNQLPHVQANVLLAK